MTREGLCGALVGFCNPMLDTTVAVSKDDLAQYGLPENGSISTAPEHTKLCEALVAKYGATGVPGGSGQATLCAAQLLLPPGSTVFFGAVGHDENARWLREAAKGAGVDTRYMVNTDMATGMCAVLVTEGGGRLLVDDLGASGTYSVEHVKEPDNWQCIEAGRLFYVTGFFLTVSPETVNVVARHAHDHNKTLALNLSASFLPDLYSASIRATLPYTSILLGNEVEAAALDRALGLGATGDLKQIAKRAADMPRAGNAPRMVVFTQGSGSTVVASSNEDRVREYSVVPVAPDQIGDTSGVGDAFAAGFLACFVQGNTLDTCIETGHWLANQAVRTTGALYALTEVPKGLTF